MSRQTPKSVLFLCADQWRAEALSTLGHLVRTPNLDRLAADGVLFRNHFTQCSPCSPARTSLLTGLYMMNHRTVRNGAPLDSRHTNIALEARKRGYDPTLFGYTDTAVDPRLRAPEDPFLRTYESVLPGMTIGCQLREDMRPWRADLKAKGYKLPHEALAVYDPVAATKSEDGTARLKPIYRAEDSDTAFLADQVLRHLSVHEGEPWFVHAVFLRPHPPIIAPEPYNSLYALADVPPPRRAESAADEAEQHPYLAYLLRRAGEPGYVMGENDDVTRWSEERARLYAAQYYGLITEVDHHVGRIVEHLKATGEYDRTLIIFTCDHGEMLGDHWLFGKEGYFDEAFHIPLIIREPGAKGARGHEVTAFTEAIDVMPTILDWLGAEVPVTCDGDSLLPFLHGKTPRLWRTEAHWEFDFREIATLAAERELGLASDECNLSVIRGPRYKYVHFAALPPLFFDLAEDPGETRNLAGDPAHRDLLLDHAQKLLSWRMIHAERILANHALEPGGMVVRKGPRRAAT